MMNNSNSTFNESNCESANNGDGISGDSNVMGGSASTNLVGISNSVNNTSSSTADPGIIAQSFQNSNNINNNDNSNTLGIPTHHNITISANDIKKELESDDLQTVIGSNHKRNNNNNALSSLIKKTATVIEKSQHERNIALEKQIIEQHRLNDWRYRGYCPLQFHATAVNTASNTATGVDGYDGYDSSHYYNNSNRNLNRTTSSSSASAFQPEPCTGGKFYVTKLRNWRTGYDRILSLHNTYFTTLDPDSNEITNIWKYSQVKKYAILHPQEENCLYIDVTDENGRSNTKLKFKYISSTTQGAGIYHIMTSFVQQKYINDVTIVNSGDMNPYQQQQFYNQYPLFQCQRLTRLNTRVDTVLLCAPHGLVEIDAKMRSKTKQTYLYKDIKAVCFVSDEGSGIVLYIGGYMSSVPFSTTNNNNSGEYYERRADPSDDNYRLCDEKCFIVKSSIRTGGSGRSDFMTVLKTKLEDLALQLHITESITLNTLVERKKQRGFCHGEYIASFPVFKVSPRIQCKDNNSQQPNNSSNSESMVARYLVLTSYGYIMEFDKENNGFENNNYAVNCRKLKDIFNLVRHQGKEHETNIRSSCENDSYPHESFSIEFKDGCVCTYFSSERDIALISILDVTVNLCRNFGATITDVLSKGYSFSLLESPIVVPQKKNLDTQGTSQSDLIEIQCLKRLSNVSSTTKSYLNTSLFSEKINATCMDVCLAIFECCREFNVNVTLFGIRNLPQDENLIVPVIHDLWEIVSYLLNFADKFQSNSKKSSAEEADYVLCVIFQSLYRLMLTPLGFNNTAEDEEVLNIMAHKLHCINDVFTLYWALKCSSALLLPRPFATEREVEKEKMNKNAVLSQMPNLAKFLVQSEVSNHTNELLLMVVSNIIESVLCSHRDTTSQEHVNMLVEELANGYQGLMTLLQSNASVIVENVFVFLYLVTTHAKERAPLIKDIALSSGVLILHLYNALFSHNEGQRMLSRSFCSLWFSGTSDSLEKLLMKRIIPEGFLTYLTMPILSDEEERQLDEIEKTNIGKPNQRHLDDLGCGAGTNKGRLFQRLKILSGDNVSRPKENFRIFFHLLAEDHTLPDLIWNEETRRELEDALKAELISIQSETKVRGSFEKVSWNYNQFRVEYPCLRNELKVGSIYLRLWLETGDSFIKSWPNPTHLFELFFRRLLCEIDHDNVVTNMCIRCIERLYSVHASKIGVFHDVMIVIRLMKNSKNAETIQRLLSFLSTLIGCSNSGDDKDFPSFIGNVEQMLNEECIVYLCQLVAWGHIQMHNVTSQEKALPSTLVPALWLLAQSEKIPSSKEEILGPFTVEKLGELMQKGEINQHSLVNAIDTHAKKSPVSENMHMNHRKWMRVEDVLQLKWQLINDSSSEVYSAYEVTALALKCLDRLVSIHKSTDSRGIPFFPIPIAKSLICQTHSPLSEGQQQQNCVRPLNIICQALLCDDLVIVDAAAKLIMKLMNHNPEVCSHLYLTGTFYFALFSGSELESVVSLVIETHLKQLGDLTLFDESPNKEKSVLIDMLPRGLLNVLKRKDVQNFIQIFSGNIDTPEVIWSDNMKRHFMAAIKQHLGPFPVQLSENSMSIYKYCPIPKIKYERLKNEIFCHKYYLSNLCDEVRFPEWQIEDPLLVFHESLKILKNLASTSEDNKKEELEVARLFFGLHDGHGFEELRAAYYESMNGLHLEMTAVDNKTFQKVTASYQCIYDYLLQNEAIEQHTDTIGNQDADGMLFASSNLKSVHLLLKTQLLICKRYPEELSQYQYSSYELLLSCLISPSIDHDSVEEQEILESCLLKKSRYELIRTAIYLIFNTCLVSPLNAEELVKENGLSSLESLLNFYIKALSILTKLKVDNNKKITQTCSVILEIVVNIVHTISGVSFFESGRTAILSLEDLHRFCVNWRRCLDLHFLNRELLGCNMLKRYALEGIASMSKNEQLQKVLIGCHITWPILSSMLGYDPAFATSHLMTEEFESTISKAEKNFQSFLATRALGMLCGVLQIDDLSTSSNGILCNKMKKVLTQPLARMLSNSESEELLQTLNVTVVSPLRLWDSSMRSELASFVKEMEEKFRNDGHQDIKDALAACDSFEYSNLANEVNIGGVYIRIFNQMDIRDAISDLPNGSHFARSLVEFIGRSIKNSVESDEEEDHEIPMDKDNHWFHISDDRFIMAVRSVLHLVELDGIVDDVMCEKDVINVLFQLLKLPRNNEACGLAHEILLLLSPKKSFADSVSQCGPMLRTLLTKLELEAIETLEDKARIKQENMHRRLWLILENLASTPTVANIFVVSSAWLELLGIIVGFPRFTKLSLSRQGAAKVLTRLIWDPSTNTIIGPLLQKFLPLPLLTIMKDMGSDTMLQAFDNDTETPELIWNSSLRGELKDAITVQLEPLFSCGITNNLGVFSLDSMFELKYKQLEDELNIGGVYVRLFLLDPSCQLRDSSGFLEMLLFHWSQLIESLIQGRSESMLSSVANDSPGNLLTVTTAIVTLCSHSYLCVKLAPWGYMKKVVIYLYKLIEKGFVHDQLLSVYNLLQVAVTERVNVESLLSSSDHDGKNGIVDAVMKSIGSCDKLHSQCSLMLKTMEDITKEVLGNVEKKDANFYLQTSTLIPMNAVYSSEMIAVAPSPAPGIDPVKKMERLAGDDPLSMFMGNQKQSPLATKKTTNNETGILSITDAVSARQLQMHAARTQQTFNHNSLSQNSTSTVNQPTGFNIHNQSQSSQSNSKMSVNSNSSIVYQPKLSVPTVQSNRSSIYQPKPAMIPGSYENGVNDPSQYKHPVPQGRGVKPLRNQGKIHSATNPSMIYKSDINVSTTVSNNNTQLRQSVTMRENQSHSLTMNSTPLSINPSSQAQKTKNVVGQQRHLSNINTQYRGAAIYTNQPINPTHQQGHSISNNPNQVQSTNVVGQQGYSYANNINTQYHGASMPSNQLKPKPQVMSLSDNHNQLQPTNAVEQQRNYYSSNIINAQYHRAPLPTNQPIYTPRPNNDSGATIYSQSYIQRANNTNQQHHSSDLFPQLNMNPIVHNTNNSRQLYHDSQAVVPQLNNVNNVTHQLHGIQSGQQMSHSNNILQQYQYTTGSQMLQNQTPSYPFKQPQEGVPSASSYINNQPHLQQSYVNMTNKGSVVPHQTQNEQHYEDKRDTVPIDPRVVAQERMKSSEGAPGSAKDNPSLEEDVDEPESAKKHAIGILSLLLMDPGYGLMFFLVSNSQPKWEKYKDQILEV